MQRGTTDLDALGAVIGRRRAQIRLLLEEDEGQLLLKRLVADFAPLPTVSRAWNYGSVTLLSGACAGSTLLQWLGRRDGEFLGHKFGVIEWYPQINWQDHPGLSPATTSPLRWPFREYRLAATGTGQQKAQILHSDFLIGRENAPSFPSVDFGGYEFMWGPAQQQRSLPIDFVLRVATTDAWIQHVKLTPTNTTIQIRGRAAVGSRVELLASLEEHRVAVVGSNRSVTIDLPRGLPSGAMLLLTRNGEWRDHRYLDPAHRGDRSDFSWDSGDRSTEIAAVIGGGESAQVEFKREVPIADVQKIHVLKTISAFANGDGGVVLFGVEDDGSIVGVPDASAEKDRLSNLINDSVTPAPPYDIKCVQVGNAQLIAVSIQSGSDVPYGIHVGGRPLTYHVRRAGTTFVAEPHQLRAVVIARQPHPQNYLDRMLSR